MNRGTCILAALLLGAGICASADAQDGKPEAVRADPLVVPLGPGRPPELLARYDSKTRISIAEKELSDRGYSEMPVLAHSLLDAAVASDEAEVLIARSLHLAPETPSVRYRAAHLAGNPRELLAAAATLLHNLPALVWLITLIGAAVGCAALATAAIVILVACTRAAPLHGHRIGHLSAPQDPPSWPGVVLLVTGLCGLPYLGAGPALVAAAIALVSAIRLRLHEAFHVAVALVVAGVILGPGLDYWARAATQPQHDPGTLAAWRIDRGQPLPEDRERLTQALSGAPGDNLVRVALATAWKREGELDRAQHILEEFPQRGGRHLEARAANLLGSVRLARGDVEQAIKDFDSARAADESCAVLYNLSQAYGRGLHLIEQSNFFREARRCDPDLITRVQELQSSNVHRHLLHTTIPLPLYLLRLARPSGDSEAIVRELRLFVFGTRAPDWAWIGLLALTPVILLFRSSAIGRCTRCERPVCTRCAPAASGGLTCGRCARLFVRGERSDPRIRRVQMELDRRRQRRIARILALVSLLAPGLARIYEGRAWSGGLRIFIWVLGGIFMLTLANGPFALDRLMPPPFEVGGFAKIVCLSLAAVLLVPLYLLALFESLRRLSTGYGV